MRLTWEVAALWSACADLLLMTVGWAWGWIGVRYDMVWVAVDGLVWVALKRGFWVLGGNVWGWPGADEGGAAGSCRCYV